MTMHKEFGEWYRLTEVAQNNDVLQMRWRGIESIRDSADRSATVELVALLYQWGCSSEYENSFRAAFQKIDGAFRQRDNDTEMAVLGGAALIAIIDSHPDSETRFAAALALRCAECATLRATEFSGPFVDLASKSLQETSASLRRTVAAASPRRLSKQKLEPLTKVGTDQAEQLAAIAAIIEAINSAFVRINEVVECQRSVQQLDALRQEESDVLWWLQGQHSIWLERPYAAVKTPVACILIGFELASLVSSPPGPFCAPALLHQTIVKTRKKLPTSIALEDAAVAAAEIAAHIGKSQGHLTPLTHCIREVASAPDAWAAACAQARIPTDSTLAPVALARQAYDEALLTRVLTSQSQGS